jgi:sugar-specific transcriptional regulator TrmB
MTNVPRSRAYDVLESLAEKGFAVIKSSQPMEYVSIPPQQAIENIKKQHRQELQEKMERLDDFKDSEAVDELESLYDQGLELVDPADMSGSLKGSRQIQQHQGTMFGDAQESIRILTSEEGLEDLRENHMDTLQEAKDAGVNVQILAPVTSTNYDHYEDLAEVAEVRHLEEDDEVHTPEGRFSIVDDDAVTMSMTHEEVHSTQDSAFWTESDHLAQNTMAPVFKTLWNKSGKPQKPEDFDQPEP